MIYNTDILEQQCASYKYHVMKDINIPALDNIRNFTTTSGPAILHLVRDPRAVYHSIKQFNGDGGHRANESYIESTCKQTQQDLEYIMQNPYQMDYHLVRYEDIALNILQYTPKLYKAVGLKNFSLILDWLTELTQVTESVIDHYSIRRNSRSVPFAWLDDMPYDVVLRLELKCARMMALVGYQPVSEYLLNNENRSFISKHILSDVDTHLRDVYVG